MQQRYRLSNREIPVTSRESTESTDGCYPSLSHYLPRPSRRSRTYACSAISKGHITRDTTRWPEIRQEFSPFLLKMAPYGVRCCGSLSFLPSPKGRRVSRKDFYETYLATKTHTAQARTRLYETYVDPQRSSCSEISPRQRALETYSLVVNTRRHSFNWTQQRGSPT